MMAERDQTNWQINDFVYDRIFAIHTLFAAHAGPIKPCEQLAVRRICGSGRSPAIRR
jgi:hypothetical protein